MIVEEKIAIVSVIIPTYNRAVLVLRAVQSILNQTCQDFELIVVDDGSTDNTKKVLTPYIDVDKIKYIYQQNSGGAAARNIGIENAVGKYIAFLDSDDEAMPEWIEQSIYKIQTLPDTWGVLYPRYYIQDDLTGVTYLNTITAKEGNIYDNLIRGEGLPIGTSGVVVKREVLEKGGGFDENLLGFHDYDLWSRLAKNWSFHFLNAPLILFRDHQDLRLMQDDENRRKALLIFHNKWKDEIERAVGKNAFKER